MSNSLKEKKTSFIEYINNKFSAYKNAAQDFIKKNHHKISNLIETNYQLGLFHLHASNINDAEFRFRMVLYFDPHHHKASYNLAKCLLAKNKKKSAIKKLQYSLKIDPDFTEAKYLMGLIEGNYDIDHIPLSIIRDHYDSIAQEFDAEFSPSNGYKLSEYMAEMLSHHIQNSNEYSILDVGCGTGKCAKSICKHINASTVIGLDISNKMLEEAKKINSKNLPLFDKLINNDYIKFFKESKHKYDIVIAGSSLHFHRDLSAILKLLPKKINQDGLLIFSVEKSEEHNSTLNSSYKNFAYNEKYVKSCIKKSGLELLELNQAIMPNGTPMYVAICKN